MQAWVRQILRCPRCGGTLADAETSLACENARCALVYRIEDAIPVLLVEEATPAIHGGTRSETGAGGTDPA